MAGARPIGVPRRPTSVTTRIEVSDYRQTGVVIRARMKTVPDRSVRTPGP
jgi:hypothetical protein